MRSPFSFLKKRERSTVGVVIQRDADGDLCVPGYTSLDKNPEIRAACQTIASLIGMMTIHLMANTERGDVRITNELSRKIDIDPERHMTRKTWMEAIVMNLLLYGNGNSVVLPHTRKGFLRRLEPISAGRVSFLPKGFSDYAVMIDGREYDPDDVLHFTYNPDKTYMWKGQGVTVSLREIANNLRQAEATKKGFLESKWKPSIIIKVDSGDELFNSKEKRKKVLEDYIEQDSAGAPWIIPADMFDVQTIKPLTLADLAISDTVEVDKRTVAAVIGVPPFVVGVGEYDADAWNSFIQSRVAPIAQGIAQELTRKLILSPEWYLRFNILSLYNWDIEKISAVYLAGGDRGYLAGNEWRDRIGLEPREGLDDLRVLENYIPVEMSGAQKKLVQE